MTTIEFETRGGIAVRRTELAVDPASAIDELTRRLDHRRGALFSSSYEVPGRYTRWDVGFCEPPLVFTGRGRSFTVEALNERGEVLLTAVERALANAFGIAEFDVIGDRVVGRVAEPGRRFAEEERSRQPSLFSVVRALRDAFAVSKDVDSHLGLAGAFGYDLAFGFEHIELVLPRPANQRDLVLYLPDELIVVDHARNVGSKYTYEFRVGRQTTAGARGGGDETAYEPALGIEPRSDHEPGGYAALVTAAKESFARGDLFEVVPGQEFVEPCAVQPSELFLRLKERNPAPYGFIINLGQSEWLVGASPEMFVRVDGDRVETCPISGTIARGTDPLGDAAQVLALLNSEKDESELTMCTDVDRNDKSRICVPGSVKVIGRRQIEMYSRLIHTVDHVEGRLREGFDALDAFLTHMWAVTVTGAPKTWAMRWIEAHERSARAWYGGAVGMVGFDGSMNTGLTLRTIRVLDGTARIRAGATLLFDSEPVAEEAETVLKASAFLDVIRRPTPPKSVVAKDAASSGAPASDVPTTARRVVLVDCEDSFVHTLANYLRACGADVTTWRWGFTLDQLDSWALEPDGLVVLSPGPGSPAEFGIPELVRALTIRALPTFGVCLGLQGIVEGFGGSLSRLTPPMHGKPSEVAVSEPGRLFPGVGSRFVAGRYHSLHADPATLPPDLRVTAATDDGVIMAIEHVDSPIAAVQFHPESIMSLQDDAGMRIIANVLANLR